MKTWIGMIAVAALALAVAPSATAQVVAYQTWTTAPVMEGPVYTTSVNYAPTYLPPYSYYAVWPWRARGYVPYGPGDTFAFYGRAYGHPNDPWTWPYMSGGYSQSLARYYYPPVR